MLAFKEFVKSEPVTEWDRNRFNAERNIMMRQNVKPVDYKLFGLTRRTPKTPKCAMCHERSVTRVGQICSACNSGEE